MAEYEVETTVAAAALESVDSDCCASMCDCFSNCCEWFGESSPSPPKLRSRQIIGRNQMRTLPGVLQTTHINQAPSVSFQSQPGVVHMQPQPTQHQAPNMIQGSPNIITIPQTNAPVQQHPINTRILPNQVHYQAPGVAQIGSVPLVQQSNQPIRTAHPAAGNATVVQVPTIGQTPGSAVVYHVR